MTKTKTSRRNNPEPGSRQRQILGILGITFSIIILASLAGYVPYEEPLGISPDVRIDNPMGIAGVYVGYFLIKYGFGYLTVLFPILGMLYGWYFFARKEFGSLNVIAIFTSTLIVTGSVTIGLVNNYRWLDFLGRYNLPGYSGSQISRLLFDFLGGAGSLLFMSAVWLMWVRGVFNWDFYAPFRFLEEKWRERKSGKIKNAPEIDIKLPIDSENTKGSGTNEDAKRKHTQDLIRRLEENRKAEEVTPTDESEDDSARVQFPEEGDQPQPVENSEDIKVTGEKELREKIENFPMVTPDELRQDLGGKKETYTDNGTSEDFNVGEMVVEKEVDLDKAKKHRTPRRKYKLPTTDLLATPVDISDNLTREELVERANFLTESLATFGVDGRVVNVHPGPVITLFEVEPAEGVRVNKFVALADDLARVMEASRVRVIAPIPGKSSVGIEIPNRNPATVYFKSVINSNQFVKSKSKLTLAVGKTTSGEIAVLDLAKMPHLLIAGTTGSGKSVCLNTILCSILYQATPEEVKFMIIDPKKVEMTLYRALDGYHLLKTEDIDEPIVTSIDNAILALRALEKEMDRRYNILADAVVRNIGEYNEKARKNKDKIMPFIVLVVDELADLMMLSAKDVEAPIARLAQLARAVGIHLVIATQRPSVDVITGVIKANFPARIAFQVASKIDSRTILDTQGAEKLIGRGDMLVIQPGSSEPVRLHNAFLSLDEIQAVMEHTIEQEKADDLILESVREASKTDVYSDDGSDDDLLNEAIKLVVTHQQGSISLLQRRLKVGYSRAARLIDAMEHIGVVGPFTGSKAREVLVDELYLQTLD